MAKGDGGGMGMMKPQPMGGMGQNMGRMGGMMGGMMQNGQFGGQKQMPSFNAGPTPDRMAEPEGATGGPSYGDVVKSGMGGINPGGMYSKGPLMHDMRYRGDGQQQGQNRLAEMFQQMRGQNQGNQFGQQPQLQGGSQEMFGPNQPPAWGRGGRFGGQMGNQGGGGGRMFGHPMGRIFGF